MSGRVLHDEGDTRFVELSASYDRWEGSVRQTIATMMGGYSPRVVLVRSGEGNEPQFELSFEEMNTLIAAYQAFLGDREAARAVPSSGCGSFDDEPPF